MKTKLIETIKKSQEALAEWIVPDSKTTDKEVLNTLLGILDSQELFKLLEEYRSQASELPSDEQCDEIAFRKLLLTGRTESEEIQDRKLIIEGLTIMRSLASPLLASKDARIKELEECLIEITEGKGRYDEDVKQHYLNCIEDMIKLAKSVLPATPSGEDDGRK